MTIEGKKKNAWRKEALDLPVGTRGRPTNGTRVKFDELRNRWFPAAVFELSARGKPRGTHWLEVHQKRTFDFMEAGPWRGKKPKKLYVAAS